MRLIPCTVDTNVYAQDGGTALSWACAYEHEAAAAELMEATKLGGALDLQVAHETWLQRCVV